MYQHGVLTALLAWPVAAALLVLLVPPRWAKHVALAASLVEFALAVPLWWTFVPAAGMPVQAAVPWIPAWGIRYPVRVDGFSLFLVLLTALLVPPRGLGRFCYTTSVQRAFV